MIPFPEKKYSVIYADPPWKYDFSPSNSRKIENQYPTLSLSEIKELPVEKICEDNSTLLLWAVCPKLDQALEVMNAWGFTFKTVAFVWVKTYMSGKPYFGMGHYTRSGSELVLLGTKGKSLPRFSHSIRQVVEAPRLEHSAKPPIVRKYIEELFGVQNRIELFARNKVEGWDCWGNEV